MLDTLGIDRDLAILITLMWAIWIYPAVFIHLYAARKLDEAERREAHRKERNQNHEHTPKNFNSNRVSPAARCAAAGNIHAQAAPQIHSKLYDGSLDVRRRPASRRGSVAYPAGFNIPITTDTVIDAAAASDKK